MARNFPGATRGADIALVSDLPPAAGMSSSSALMVGVFLVLAEVNRLAARDEYWHNIGSPSTWPAIWAPSRTGRRSARWRATEAWAPSAAARTTPPSSAPCPSHISQYAYAPIEFEKMIPVPPGYVFAVGASGVAAEKTGAARAKYNSVAGLSAALVDLWRQRTGRDDANLAAALDSSPDAASRLMAMLESPAGLSGDIAGSNQAGTAAACSAYAPGVAAGGLGISPAVLPSGGRPAAERTGDGSARRALLARRAALHAQSGEIVPQASEALAAGELEPFGRLVDRSQHAAEKLLGNQTPETVFLAASARRLGAVAASSFGAGFGGSVWARSKRPRPKIS